MIWILLFSILPQFQSEWKKITIPELHFSVLSPGYMYRIIDEISTSTGTVTVYSYKYEPEDHDDNLLYLIQAYRFGDDWDVEDDLYMEILEVGMEESMDKLKATLDYQQMIPMESGLCLLYRINYAKGTRIMKSKVMIVNKTFISLQVYCESTQSLNTSMDYFLNSFRLTN